jgi:hypothetical protein
MFIVLVTNRFDTYDRYWVRRQTLEEARKVAREYEKNNSHTTEIYELGADLS